MSPSELEDLLNRVTPEQGRKLEAMLKTSSDKELAQLDMVTIEWALKMKPVRKELKMEVVTKITKPKSLLTNIHPDLADPEEGLDGDFWGV